MRLKTMNKRTKFVTGVAGLGLVAAGTGGAFAFYVNTTNGEGSTVLSGEDLPELDAYAEIPDLTIGTSGTVNFYATNSSSGSTGALVKGIDMQTLSVTPPTSEPCPGGSFELVGKATMIPTTIAPGDTALVATQQIVYNNLPKPQNGCNGATLLVTFKTL